MGYLVHTHEAENSKLYFPVYTPSPLGGGSVPGGWLASRHGTQRTAKKEAVALNEEERGGGKMTGCAKRKAKPAQVKKINFV